MIVHFSFRAITCFNNSKTLMELLIASQNNGGNKENDNNPTPDKFNDKGGYYKFPNGLIMQWGNINGINIVDLNGKTPPHITFPIPFPTKVLNITLSIYAPQNINNGISNVYSRNTTRTGSDVITDAYSHGAENATIYWYALGY